MADNDQRLIELLDREAIRDCMYRYCRDIDRADEVALRSAYRPDATDRHGAIRDRVESFVQMALESFKPSPRSIHQVRNVLIEFKNETSVAVESYFNALSAGRAAAVSQFQPWSGYPVWDRKCDRFFNRKRRLRSLRAF